MVYNYLPRDIIYLSQSTIKEKNQKNDIQIIKNRRHMIIILEKWMVNVVFSIFFDAFKTNLSSWNISESRENQTVFLSD